MYLFEFITQEEVDDLPDDDPQAAFTTFVRHAQRRLRERIRELEQDSEGWREINESRLSFMNVVIAAAKRFEVEPFASMEIPRVGSTEIQAHDQFRADLDHYLTQILLDSGTRARRDSVTVSAELKSKIRSYVHHLRKTIDDADDLDAAKKEILLQRLAEFEAELEKKRLNLLAVSLLAITIASAPGGVWSSAEIANKLLGSIMRSVGEAKIADDATRRLPARETPLAITAPRRAEPTPERKSARPEIDDDIPF